MRLPGSEQDFKGTDKRAQVDQMQEWVAYIHWFI